MTMETSIESPVNVRILHPDGTYTPVETVYANTTEDGVNHWYTVRALNLVPGDRPCWDEMPQQTKVHFSVHHPDKASS